MFHDKLNVWLFKTNKNSISNILKSTISDLKFVLLIKLHYQFP